MLTDGNHLGHDDTVNRTLLEHPGRNFRAVGDHPAITYPDSRGAPSGIASTPAATGCACTSIGSQRSRLTASDHQVSIAIVTAAIVESGKTGELCDGAAPGTSTGKR